MLQAAHCCVVCCTFGVPCCILHVACRTLLNLAHCLMLRRVLCVALCTSDAVSEVARCTPPLACCIFRVVRRTPPGRSASTRHVASTWTGCRRRRSRRPKTSSGSSTSAPTTAPPPPPTYAIARVVRRATRGRATDFGRTDYSQRVVCAYTRESPTTALAPKSPSAAAAWCAALIPAASALVRRRYVQGRFKPYFEDSPHALYTVRTHRSYTGGASECVRACERVSECACE